MAASGATVRSKSDMRLWEAVVDRSAPVSWPWADGAESATLVFSNHVTRAVASVAVQRGGDEPRGSCSHPVPPGAGEALFDVTLEQLGHGAVIERESAVLAYVPGAGGGPVTVRAMGTREWNRVRRPRVVAFDPEWLGESGESGYSVVWPKGLCLVFR